MMFCRLQWACPAQDAEAGESLTCTVWNTGFQGLAGIQAPCCAEGWDQIANAEAQREEGKETQGAQVEVAAAAGSKTTSG